ILTANNMFRTWDLGVKRFLKIGNNQIKIVFESAVNRGEAAAKLLNYELPGNEKVFTRKAQYHYGWDWGPRFVTCGIYKAIQLHFWNQAKINHVQFIQEKLTKELALIQFKVEVNCNQKGIYHFEIYNSKPSRDLPLFKDTFIELQKGINTVLLNAKIKNPELWWTHNLGKQNLYNYTIVLESASKKIDLNYVTFGLRTIELVQENDSLGKSFLFKLNGIPVFMKGANYIPEDNFLPRVPFSKTKQLINDAKAANMNMLRVWGGGEYASDYFYQLCNENGILVWQDFMFACAMYPGDSSFLENVIAEVNNQIIRLRNNPSLAIWCGNNEIDEGWKNWGWQKQFKYNSIDSTKIWNDYVLLFENNIKNSLQLLDKARSYWPSSPSIGWGRKESLTQGDAHYWGVWWGMQPFKTYEKKVGRFMSEFGFQGMPTKSTFTKMGALQYTKYGLKIDSTILKTHQKHPTGFETIQTYMERDFNIPKSFENYVYISQLLQAEGMKIAIEAYRRAMPYCMGTLYWQLNDCWPVTSWSSIDYDGNWKALHYQVKKSYENLLVSFEEKNDAVLVFIVSDKLENIKGNLTLKVLDFDGKIVFTENLETIVKPNTSSIYYYFDKSKLKGDMNLNNLVLSTTFNNENTKINSLFYFVKSKDLLLSKPTVSFKFLKNNQIEISSNKLAKNVFLNTNNESLIFDDNYFDLLPNEKKIIQFNESFSPKILPKITIKTLFDAK
ncbi:MAG: glycoside hydrolase family 2 protein, partial [Bacteroidia bacterium]|nr:glycoside hydrolase family 2 protein [Bacteroidia bacterium]